MCPLRFFFNYTASTEIYTLPLHDALPILVAVAEVVLAGAGAFDRHLLRAQPDQHRRGVGLAVAAGDGREDRLQRAGLLVAGADRAAVVAAETDALRPARGAQRVAGEIGRA